MPTVRGCELPDELLYDVENHTWFEELGDGNLKIGMTAVAAAMAGELVEVRGLSISTLDQLCNSVQEVTFFCGEGLPAVHEDLVAWLGSLACFPPKSAILRRPGHLAEMGWQRLSKGQADDPSTLQPVYLRGPSITRPRPFPVGVKR